ncbi:hypothetical protein HY750_01495 [Candidatus Kuenenbacteria bacterium]|nr:hypothetical protein [Candidatus Kuenenbacteria bacterium]
MSTEKMNLMPSCYDIIPHKRATSCHSSLHNKPRGISEGAWINIKQNRFAQLAKLGEIIFHTKDLANLWQIKNSNTLYTTLKRYAQQELLFRIYKGFYSIKPINQLDPFLLGTKAMHKFCYISAETVLEKAGIIQQKTNYITLISSVSKKFNIGDYSYCSRQLDDKFLFKTTGIINKDGIKIATTQRAVADLLYFNPKIYFDNNKLINWKEIKRIQQEIGYPLTSKRYDFT